MSPGSHLGEASSLAQGGVEVMQEGAATQTQCKVVTETQGLDQYPPVEGLYATCDFQLPGSSLKNGLKN